MRHAMTLLGALAILVLAAGAQADWLALTNWSNGDERKWYGA